MNVLIIYYYYDYPIRSTIRDHLYSFHRFGSHRCFYLNVGVRSVPWYIRAIPFDVIVFHTIFLSARWSPPVFRRNVDAVRALKHQPAIKVALPQDEFINTEVLNGFLREFGVSHVFSVAPPSEWAKIYPGLAAEGVSFHEVLTGYLDDATTRKIDRLADESRERAIDVGYRAWRAEPWLGRHGFLKTQIADVFADEAPRRGLRVDISTRAEDSILGDDWYRYLLRCRYTIGVEGGASILDPTGEIRERTSRYVTEHPDASFEEIEAACFPGKDGELALFALSPRHLEACATRTCQVLVEGRYNGALEAGRHYIPLKRDLSNVREVIDHLGDEGLRRQVVTRAYDEVVGSRRYSYAGFVALVLGTALAARPRRRASASASATWIAAAGWWARVADWWDWRRIQFGLLDFRNRARGRIRRAVVRVIPPAIRAVVRRVADRVGP
jgi:hypothetical protein